MMKNEEITPNELRDGDVIVGGAFAQRLTFRGQTVARIGAGGRVSGFDVLVEWPNGFTDWKFFGHNVRLVVERA